jgi:hypothetical protein
MTFGTVKQVRSTTYGLSAPVFEGAVTLTEGSRALLARALIALIRDPRRLAVVTWRRRDRHDFAQLRIALPVADSMSPLACRPSRDRH